MVNKEKLKDKDFIKQKYYFTLRSLKNSVDHAIRTAELNHKDLDDCIVMIENSNTLKNYLLHSTSVGFTNNGLMVFTVPFKDDDQIDYSDPDIRPEYGEYWYSRGPGYDDCSGFVKTKAAGERIMRYVKAILETDTPKTWLDYREREPNWIQLKFHGDEFNLELLDKLTKENDNIITYEIMKKCKKS